MKRIWLAGILVLLIALAYGTTMLFQYRNEGLKVLKLDGTGTQDTQITAGFRYERGNDQIMTVTANYRVAGEEKFTSAWLEIGKRHLPYRIANIRVTVDGSPFGQVDVSDPGHKPNDPAFYSTNDSLTYRFGSALDKDGGTVSIRFLPESPVDAKSTITWTYDIVRDNLIGWTVLRNETIVVP